MKFGNFEVRHTKKVLTPEMAKIAAAYLEAWENMEGNKDKMGWDEQAMANFNAAVLLDKLEEPVEVTVMELI